MSKKEQIGGNRYLLTRGRHAVDSIFVLPDRPLLSILIPSLHPELLEKMNFKCNNVFRIGTFGPKLGAVSKVITFISK